MRPPLFLRCPLLTPSLGKGYVLSSVASEATKKAFDTGLIPADGSPKSVEEQIAELREEIGLGRLAEFRLVTVTHGYRRP